MFSSAEVSIASRLFFEAKSPTSSNDTSRWSLGGVEEEKGGEEEEEEYEEEEEEEKEEEEKK